MDRPRGRTINIITLGQSLVGKTAILNRYIYGTFAYSSMQTVGVEMLEKYVGNDKLRIWDTSG
jgi:GTPase SAR1 family protein